MTLRLLGAVLLLLTTASFRAQTPAAASGAAEGTITFVFDWPAQSMPHYEVSVAPDGTGVYRSTPSGAAPAGSSGAQPILLSHAVLEHIEPAAAFLRSGKPCESPQKKVAHTGTKTLILMSGGAPITCTYNYPDDKRVQEATSTFQALAVTMEEAPRLEHLHRFDRLGLDAELGMFVQSVQDGRAIEVGNIAATLRSLAADADLMERVRSRAADLLARASSAPAS